MTFLTKLRFKGHGLDQSASNQTTNPQTFVEGEHMTSQISVFYTSSKNSASKDHWSGSAMECGGHRLKKQKQILKIISSQVFLPIYIKHHEFQVYYGSEVVKVPVTGRMVILNKKYEKETLAGGRKKLVIFFRFW